MPELQVRKDRKIPRYIQFQFISNHIENEVFNTAPDLLPDALKWRKISYLASHGYLGRYPGYFFDGSIRNEDYLNKILNQELISHEEELYNTGIINLTGDNSILSNGIIDNTNKQRGSISSMDNADRSYYTEGKIDWNANFNTGNEKGKKVRTNSFLNDEALADDLYPDISFKIKDLSLPSTIEKPKTEVKLNISETDNSVSVELVENILFNLYPRGGFGGANGHNNKGTFITIPLDTYVTPLLCIYYYEVEILNGIEGESDIVIGFVKDEIKNITYTSSSMIDLRGTDDRAVGWYGKNGFLTIWNDKRIEKSACKFGKGDIVGMGYNLYRDVFFITKNGLIVCEIPSVEKFLDKSFEGRKNVRGFIPSISLGSWNGVKINLGDDELGFKFDIENYVKKSKCNLMQEIKLSRNMAFNLPNNDEKKTVKSDLDLTHYADELVIGYLKYGGYLDTVKAMETDLKDLNRREGKGVSKVDTKLMELCHLKKMVKKHIIADELSKTRKLLESKYPGFFITYRKINFRMKVLKLINMIVNGKKGTLECVRFASQLKNLFKEEDCQYYIDQVSILFSFENPKQTPEFRLYFDDNKTKVIHAIIMAINEQNGLPFISSLDLVILRTDQNLETYVDNMTDESKRGPLLLNLLEDYIKF